ncbi:glycosyltransferase family 4 protein [Pontibacter sp. MBLB2868]|uniref:glycosyltransferase family 4 protein n=1 Tax=Pontibacter sp. MBLB2868 TaxID=3451555 RepID=UPI003F756706
MKVIFSHPTGNANVRATANALFEANLLAEFHTAVASFPGSILDMLGSIGPFSEIRRRRFDIALRSVTKMHPWREIGRLAASKKSFYKLIEHETGLFSVDAVYHSIDKKVASGLKSASRRGVDAVYTYEDCAESSFLEAKRLGLKCFYDLPTGYWRSARRLLGVEKEKWPEWEHTFINFKDSDAKLSRKDSELRMADHVIVASKFVAKTLLEFSGPLAPVTVIPYGFPPVVHNRSYPLKRNRLLKLLFVGNLSHQKGIAYLLAAVEAYKNYIELTIIGSKVSNNCPALDRALARHKWIPNLPHGAILQLMREHDVLVFPSLFDGFGLVITEAMSQGTPVIATERSAGPDLIQDGQNGWLVEAASTQALQVVLEYILDHPESVAKVGSEAVETARKRPWQVYKRELVEAITN